MQLVGAPESVAPSRAPLSKPMEVSAGVERWLAQPKSGVQVKAMRRRPKVSRCVRRIIIDLTTRRAIAQTLSLCPSDPDDQILAASADNGH